MSRRTFLDWTRRGLNALLATILAVPAFRFLRPAPQPASTDPETPEDHGFLRVGLESMVRGERPVRVPIIARRVDAYTTHPPAAVGSVWLVREKPERDDSPVRCLHVICPHLGCAVDFAADRGTYFCPCHASDFDRLGRRLTGPSPRDLDTLPCRISAPDESGRRYVEVKFERYQVGIADKRAIS